MGMVEKISGGAAVMLIQQFMPAHEEDSNDKIDYFQWVLVCGCGGASICGLLGIAILWRMKIGER